MAYSEDLAERLRKVFSSEKGVSEKKMFGGLCFMVYGNMCCGIVGNKLMLRVNKDEYESILKEVHVQEMTFTGKPMRGMIYVLPKGITTTPQLKKWVKVALNFVTTLPKK